jgi:hypothetical protein
MLPLLAPLVLKAAEAVPGLLGLLKGHKAEAVADRVLTAAKSIAGVEEPAAAVEKIAQDPELLKMWVVETNKVVVAEMQADLESLRIVNDTMRAETSSNDPVVRWWRPAFGYIVAASWGWLFFSVGDLLMSKPETAPGVLNALAALFPMWGVALTVLGVSVRERSKDKARQAGIEPPALLDLLPGLKGPASRNR